MTILDPWQELVKGLELAEELERNRPRLIKEYRLYYNTDGTIIGLWETGHPEGNYIVLSDPDIFHRTNTNLLRVSNGALKIIDPHTPIRVKIKKSTQGQRVVKGHAALALTCNEEYTEIEFYERTNN
jgi:hypothetical protein